MADSIAESSREQSRSEEITNSISHGVGLVAMLIGAPLLIMSALEQRAPGQIIGTIVFSSTAIFLYLSSTIYHALLPGKTKRVFRVIEHSAIFLLIAGTYTPFTLGVLQSRLGWILFSLVWALAAVGIAMKVFETKPHPVISTGLYLVMGWLLILVFIPLLAKIPSDGLILLIFGGLFYTVGVAFFATDSRLQYGHFIWHLFVMAGTTCHYFAILWFAA